MEALEATWWGFVGGAALLLGAVVGLYVPTSQRTIAFVMALGSGVLIASVAFELTESAFDAAGLPATALGIVLGAVVYFGADCLVERSGGQDRKRSQGQQGDGSGAAITVGALLDGIPESIAIGVSLLGGGSVSVTMVAAVFLSNIPEGLSGAVGLKRSGRSAAPAVTAGIQAFAAGAILTMLASTMLPEAYEDGGPVIGLVTTAGFLAAFVLSRTE